MDFSTRSRKKLTMDEDEKEKSRQGYKKMSTERMSQREREIEGLKIVKRYREPHIVFQP